MKVLEFLQSENARISYGDRWLVIDGAGIFTVMERKYGAKKTKVLSMTTNEEEAIAALKGDDE